MTVYTIEVNDLLKSTVATDVVLAMESSSTNFQLNQTDTRKFRVHVMTIAIVENNFNNDNNNKAWVLGWHAKKCNLASNSVVHQRNSRVKLHKNQSLEN